MISGWNKSNPEQNDFELLSIQVSFLFTSQLATQLRLTSLPNEQHLKCFVSFLDMICHVLVKINVALFF